MLELSALLNERLEKSAEASSTAARGFHERGGKTVSYINLFNEMVSAPPRSILVSECWQEKPLLALLTLLAPLAISACSVSYLC